MDAHSEQIERLWVAIEELSPGPRNRFALGRTFHDLRVLYSDRNSGGHRLTSGHGRFETEIRKRSKYSPRAVRDMIADYEASLRGEPSTSAKRKVRRALPKEPLIEFARLLPYRAAHAAYREAAKVYHPDHGGSNAKMQRLNAAWEKAQVCFSAH